MTTAKKNLYKPCLEFGDCRFRYFEILFKFIKTIRYA